MKSPGLLTKASIGGFALTSVAAGVTIPMVIKSEKEEWAINKSGSSLSLAYSKDNTCSINVTSNNSSSPSTETIDAIKKLLEYKFGNKTLFGRENQKNRRGFIKKCTDNSNSLNLTATSELSNLDLSTLFDFSSEKTDEFDEDLIKNGTWKIYMGKTGNKEITATVNIKGENKFTSCEIIGTSQTEDDAKLKSSLEDIKTKIEGKINSSSNKETQRRSFLTNCNKSLDGKIKKSLTLTNNKYSVADLDNIFS